MVNPDNSQDLDNIEASVDVRWKQIMGRKKILDTCSIESLLFCVVGHIDPSISLSVSQLQKIVRFMSSAELHYPEQDIEIFLNAYVPHYHHDDIREIWKEI